MPDPIDTNLPPSSAPTPAPVAEPAPAPATDLPNPQDAVNAALNTSTPIAEPSTPTPSAAPSTEPMPPLEPLSQTPKVETVTTVESPSVSASGDDVPLSLVTPPSAPTVTTTTTTTPPADTTAPTPVVTTTTTTTPPAEEPAVIPPVSPLPPAPADGFKPLPEKKKKTSKVILAILGFFFMIGLVGFGYYYFETGKTPQIAATCSGYFACLEWKKGRDEQDQINANSKQAQYGGYAGGGTGPNSNLAKGNSEGLAEAKKIAESAAQAAGKSDKDVEAAGAAAAAKLKAAADAGNAAATYDTAKQIKAEAAMIKAKADAEAAAGGNTDAVHNTNFSIGMYPVYKDGASSGEIVGYRYINAPGVFEAAVARAAYSSTQGATAGSIGGDLLVLQRDYGMTPENLSRLGFSSVQDVLVAMQGNQTWVPPGVGCSGGATEDAVSKPASYCGEWHFTTCQNGGGVNGVGCGLTSKTTGDNPDETPNPSPSGSSSLVCTGITRTPTTTPVVGSVLTFTCAGTVTPTATLSYDFRYSINDATPSALVNKTATTAELTINACGSYKVQCRACATIAGVKQCSPVWVGATQ